MVLFFFSGRPFLTPNNQTITAVYNHPLRLSMDFCANPPYNKVLWIVKDKALGPGDSDGRLTAHHITVSFV